jgi:hypothetical protein
MKNVRQKYTIQSIFFASRFSMAGWRAPYNVRTGVWPILLIIISFFSGFLSISSQAQVLPARQVPQAPKVPASPVMVPVTPSVAPAQAPSVELGKNDTILTGAILYQGDTIPFRELADVYIFDGTPEQYARMVERWTRLRNAVYITYPYAVAAGKIINDINSHLAYMTDEGERKKYIKSREKELKLQFGNHLEQLSVYQGKILMKLINRQTGNNCYNIVKEYRGGFDARMWQTVAFFFGSNLKQPYDAGGDDKPIEQIVQEIQRMYSTR